VTIQLIQQYYTKVEKLIQYGGSRNETAIRSAFQSLLEQYCTDKNLVLVPELDYKTKYGTVVNPDATLKDALRQDWGYWESKDTFDTLDDEIQKKLEKGYPTTNLLFEDSQNAVLIQNDIEVSRVDFRDANALHAILIAFTSYEPQEVQTFRTAIEKFKQDLPDLVNELRQLIEKQAEENVAFAQARADFLELCRESINPHIVMADIREMLIQHILTEDIFITIFNNAQFHQENNIACELAKITRTFFVGAIQRNILLKIDPYIRIIKAAASNIFDHHEKQRFLKVFYETFYRAYNPAGADRLGIIYTPNEIVRFIVEGAEHLVYKHFDRLLGDKDVEILDPATGTGTFITEIIELLPKHILPYKYKNEIHCNEVAILPYYIANLNIEYTYFQKMNQYCEFKNICFVDTLDNLGFTYDDKQAHFLSISTENLERIKQQNQRKISVIVGNPPYNANQLNENENNKNRTYPQIDKRIKDTYIKHSTAQKTKLYDMYSRFIRWASDRLAPNGIISFVTNNSFIDKKTYDGFRKVLADEFNEIYVVDMKGDARTSGERRRQEGGNVFSDQIRVGIAILFLLKNQQEKGCKIYYTCVDDYLKAEAKIAYLRGNKLRELPFVHIIPDKKNYWINLPENDWNDLLPVATKETKSSKKIGSENAVFKAYSNGVNTARDQWVVDLSKSSLRAKMEFLTNHYNSYHTDSDEYDTVIKWSRNLKQRHKKGLKETFRAKRIIDYHYRPFCKFLVYYSDLFLDEHGIASYFLGGDNALIAVNVGNKPFNVVASKYLVDWHFNGDACCLPRYRYFENGKQADNITDWALLQFRDHYRDASISKEAVFAYVYAVLHHPAYREKYAANLKRELPRVPFYEDFHQWETWGEKLMNIHLNYEKATPYPFKRVDLEADSSEPPTKQKTILKADKHTNSIRLDSITTLKDIPYEAWEYRLGNRSAIEWVLEYYKERKPKDPTILQKFNTYRFTDYKDQVVDLLAKVCTVSVETTRIIREMSLISS
jgi:predicted helicase